MTHISLKDLIESVRPPQKPYEELRAYFHSHPELSERESDTAATIAARIHTLSAFDVHEKIGGHGLAAVLKNGQGKVVLLRADFDALPVQEQTGLPYASRVKMEDYDGITKPVMHACGHDIHITCLLAAAEMLVKLRNAWNGTLILVFQPAEERGSGAKSMVDDGLYNKVPIPDVVLGQHVMANRAGVVGSRTGIMMAASDSRKITMYGRGGHASMPHRTIDPVVMAASTVMRLQTLVSREVNPSDMAVVTVGSLQAGQTENVIADSAELLVNVRTINLQTRERVLSGIERIVRAESDASGAGKEPSINKTSSFPATVNDEAATKTLQDSFRAFFGSAFDHDMPRTNGSEDFSYLGTSIGKPCSFWLIGGTDPDKYDRAEKSGRLMEDIPVNHSPFFAPVMQPTLRVGMDALALAAMTFFTQEAAI